MHARGTKHLHGTIDDLGKNFIEAERAGDNAQTLFQSVQLPHTRAQVVRTAFEVAYARLAAHTLSAQFLAKRAVKLLLPGTGPNGDGADTQTSKEQAPLSAL